MYNLAKLLTEEPAKLEKLMLLFLKLLITFFFVCLLFGYNFSIYSLIKEPIPPSLSTSKLIYFFLGMIVSWYVIWVIIAEAIINGLLVWLLAMPFNGRKAFVMALSFLGVIKEKNDILSPNTNIILFTEAIKELKEEESDKFIQENHSRVKQYFVISIAIYVLLFVSKDIKLSWIEIFIGVYIVLNFLVLCVLLYLVKTYVYENIESLKREFEPLSYSQKTHNAVSENKEFERNYEKPTGGINVHLKRKGTMDYYPEEIKINIGFHWNQSLGQTVLTDTFKVWNEKSEKRTLYTKMIFVTNIKPTQEMSSLIGKLDGFIYVYALNEKEIFSGLEESWYFIQKRHRIERKALSQTNDTK
jgi:hypothetical protein